MIRRGFLKNILLLTFAFIFGYSVKKVDENMILQQIDSTLFKDKDTKSITNGIRLLNDSKVEVVNIKEKFGAIGDGKTDNYQAILKAGAYAKVNDSCLYIPSGNYYCSRSIVIEGVKHIIIDGTINMGKGKVFNLIYGSYLGPANWKIFNINGRLLLSGLNSSRVEVMKAKELELYAHGNVTKKEFIAYNTFILGKIDTFKIFSEGSRKGWINENKFYGGRMINISIDGNYHHNNNIFYGTMLEGFTLALNKGSSNFFYDVRLEGTNSINFGVGTSDNIIYKSWYSNPFIYLRDSMNIPYQNEGFNNQIISNLDTFHRKDLIFSIDSKSNNFKLSTLNRRKNDLSIAASEHVLFETDLIELKNPFGIIVKSDQSLFHVDLYAYDKNRKVILIQQTDFTSLSGGIFNSKTGAYSFDGNVGKQNTGIPLFPHKMVKYIRYQIRTGSETTDKVFNYLNVIKIESNVHHTPIKLSNKFKRWTHTEKPSRGYWEEGDIVWNAGKDKDVIFWERLTTGKKHSLKKDWIER
ncbi:hypothetical protein U8Y98_25990 [Priestia megaterium]|uniref:glycosyl hydrolase family 28-related protein n=1 Tax=Priestia megaterium TaxID=1404 RepID=UPI002FE074F1